jgi:hypothetical protein
MALYVDIVVINLYTRITIPLNVETAVEHTFYACNDEAIYKAHAGLNIKGLRIIVICRQRLLKSGGTFSFPIKT